MRAPQEHILITSNDMKTILIALTMSAALTAAQATIFYNETFSYPDGDLTTVSGGLWVAHSGAGVRPIQVSSGTISLIQGPSGEDVNRDTGSVMGAGDTWYAGFDVNVTGGSTAVYFAHFLQSSSAFGGRVFVTPPTSGGDFAFGLSSTSSSFQSAWPSDSAFGTTYRVVVSYDFTSQGSALWVDPTQQSDPSITAAGTFSDAMYGFAFRQGSGDSTEVIDNLVVANDFMEALTGVAVPEPGTMSLCLLGGLALLGARLRRPRV